MFKKLISTQVLISLILLVAAFLRLYRIADYMTFLGDEGRDALVAYNILHGHLTLLGPTASVGGFFFGPLYYYMMAPFLLLFNYNPVGPAVMVALLGIATVWLVYKLGELFLNKWVGIIAAFLYAIAPIIIAYARSSWNPNPVPFFSFLLILLFYKAVTKKSQLLFLVVGILWGVIVELHFVTGVLVLVLFPYLLIHFFLFEKQKKSITTLIYPALYIILGFLIGMLPYLGFEVRHNFPNVRSFTQFLFFSGKVTASGNGFVILANVYLRLFGRILVNADSIERIKSISSSLSASYLFPLLLGVASLSVFVIQIIQTFKKGDKSVLERLLLLAVWLIGGTIIFGFYHKAIYDYYFGFMYAVPFLLTANLLVFLWNQKVVFKAVSIILFLWLVWLSVQGVPFRYGPNRQLHQTEVIAKEVLNMTQNQPYNFALITGGNSDHAYRYFLTLWGKPPVTIENSFVDPKRTTVTKQLIVVCESLPCSPLGVSLWEIAGFGRADVAGKKHVIVVDIYKLIHYTGK